MEKTNKIDAVLDVINIGNDYARRAFRKGVEAIAEAVRHRMIEDFKTRKSTRLLTDLESESSQQYLSPPSEDHILSFFDNYDVIGGVSVYTLNLPNWNGTDFPERSMADRLKTLKNRHASEYLRSYRNLNQRPSLAAKGVELKDNKFSCHAFSEDDTLLACGARNGAVVVWNASRGTLLRVLSGQHDFPIADVAFHKGSSRTVVSVDLSGVCVCWDLDRYPGRTQSVSCVADIKDEDFLGMEGAVPCLSKDGNFVALPIFMYAEPDSLTGNREFCISLDASNGRGNQSESEGHGMTSVPQFFAIVNIFEVCKNPSSSQRPPLFTLAINVSERWTGSECMLDLVQFSRTSNALLFTVYELSKGYLVLWPRLLKHDTASYKLEGTKGRFNVDDKLLVTWRAILSSSEGCEDSRCFVWDVENLVSVPLPASQSSSLHPRSEAISPLVLTDPNNGSVQSCDFLSMSGSVGIAVVAVTETLHVVVWCIGTQIPVYILESGLRRSDVLPESFVNIVEETTRMERTCGVITSAVSPDGKWIGAYSSISRTGLIWNAQLGVEVFRISNPKGSDGPHRYVDLAFSECSSNLALIGKTRVLLWDAVALQCYNRTSRPLYTLNSSQADLFGGIVSCKFSRSGSAIGLLPSYALSLDVWNLDTQTRYELNRQKVLQEFATDANRRRLQRSSDIDAGKYRFCRFAIDQNVNRVVTCMGDMSVLLWDMRDLTRCRRIATLSSEYFPALDVCFSQDEEHRQTIVICQDQGILVWIDVVKEVVVHRSGFKNLRTCKFSNDGKQGILVLDLFRVEVVSLVERSVQMQYVYPVPLFNQSAFPPLLSCNGHECLLGFDQNCEPIICTPGSRIEDLSPVCQAPEHAALSEDGDWVLMYGNIDQDSDDLSMDVEVELDVGKSEPVEGYPAANYKAALSVIGTFKENKKDKKKRFIPGDKGWKLVNLRGTGSTKHIRMPFEMVPEAFIAISADGRRCAALNARHQLIVWSASYTYGTITHLRERFSASIGTSSHDKDELEGVLQQHGPSLLNHPSEFGMTPVMECVYHKNKTVLSQILSWSVHNRINLALQGNIKIPKTTICFRNILEIALYMRVPDIAKMIASAMLEGATNLTGVCQIFEEALIPLSHIYPSLALDLWKNKNALTPLCTVYLSEGFFKEQKHQMAVLTDKSNVTSRDYIQQLWSGQEQRSMRDLNSLYEIRVAAEAKVFPYPNAAKIGREGVLQALLLQNTDHQIFGSEPVKAIINFKYETYGRSIILEDIYHYTLLLILYTAFCIAVGYEDWITPGQDECISLDKILVVVCFGYLIRFLKQINTLWANRRFRGLLYYASDVWKWIEFLSYILVVVVIPLVITFRDRRSQLLDSFMAIASVFLWVKLLYYAQAFKPTGSLIVMIKEIAKDIKWFLFVLLALLVGFGIAFFILLSGDSDRNARNRAQENSENMTEGELKNMTEEDGESWHFNRPWSSTLTMFLFMLSDVNDILSLIVNDDSLLAGTKVLAVAFLVIFLTAAAIILLNLLIAIMGDSFERVKSHEKTQFLKKRAEVILDMEMGLSESRKKKLNGNIAPYLHVLTPKYQTGLTSRDWEGRIVDVQRKMGEELSNLKELEKNDLMELRTEMTAIKKLLSDLKHSHSRSNLNQQTNEIEAAAVLETDH